MHVVVTAGLGDEKLRRKLAGLVENPRVAEIVLVRRVPLADVPKLRNVNPGRIAGCCTLFFECWRLWTLWRLLARERPAMVFGIQFVLHGFAAAAAGWMTRTPSVVWLIGSDVHVHLATAWKRRLTGWALRRARFVGIMGWRSREIVRNCGVSEQRLIEMQVFADPERFAVSEAKPKWDLVFCGRLVPVKRLDQLLSAVAFARHRLPSIRVAIVGDGPEREALAARVKALKLQMHVQLVGATSDVAAYLHKARALVLSSASEGVPTAAIEAMLCGLPVILTDVGDVRAVFKDGVNALLVKPNRPRALADAIVRLLTRHALYEQLRQGARASRRQYLDRWNTAGQVALWDRLLDAACPIPEILTSVRWLSDDDDPPGETRRSA